MKLLALLTLNLILLTGFIRSTDHVNRDRPFQTKNETNTKNDDPLTSTEELAGQSVLGSYIISYEAVSSNLTKEEPTPDQSEQASDLTPTPTEIEIDTKKVLTPTPTTEPTSEVQSVVLEALDNATLLMNKINSHRGENGLSNYSFNPTVCKFALLRAEELKSDFSHSGFRSRIDSNTLPYSDYSHVAENIADTDTFTRAFDLWHNSPGHNENMLSEAVYGCVGNTGRFYTLQTWSP